MKQNFLIIIAILLGTLYSAAQSDEYGSWNKVYYKDTFGDIDYNRPYMATWIDGSSNVNLGVIYRYDGQFVFKLFDDDRDIRSIYSDQVIFSIKYNDRVLGPVVANVWSDEIRFGGDDNEGMFRTLFNSGNFKICIEYESYGNQYSYVFDIVRRPGEFIKAAMTLLGR